LSMMEGELIEIPSIAHIEDRHSQSSKHRGFFYPNKTSGDFIIKGMKIGEITDFFGNVMDTVYAEESGVILYMIGTPPINKGETLVNIGKIVKE